MRLPDERSAARPARGARRGLFPSFRLPPIQRVAGRGREEGGAEPPKRRCGLAPSAEPGDHRRAAALGVDLRCGCAQRRGRPDSHFAMLQWLRERGFRTNPHVELVDSIEEVAKVVAAWETAAHRSRLRDRRRRDQGRLVRPAAAARCAARAATVGARVQVGADDGADEAAQDPDPRGSHRRSQPVGAARASRGRRRHRLARDAPQRGGHQPKGDPRGRSRDRPAGRRRDPAGRRCRGRARPRDEAFQDADTLPALRCRGRETRGRGHAPLPEPRLSRRAGWRR